MKKLYLLVLSTLALVLSVWLMHHTLSYDSSANSILVGSKYWSDFGNALPLVRSFSYGSNWTWEHPLFPGEPTRYHLLFYYLTGMLEKVGLRFDLALNIPSILGFFFLCLMIWSMSLRLFKRHSVALLSVLFFLFNGSFSWLDFLDKYGFSLSSLKSLVHFPSFGPWNGSQISAFWNLNIYTNQRHLPLSFVVALVIIYILYSSKPKLIYFVGILLGFLLLSNQAAFGIAALFTAWLFIFSSHKFKIIVSLLGFLPFLTFSLRFTQLPNPPFYHPAFLYNGPLEFWPIAKYWFLNFGPHLILIPVGILFSLRRTWKLALPLILLFILPNLFQFSPDMINNHKFFNFFLIIGSMFSAYLIVRFKPLLILLPLLILGGIVDFFPVKNDNYGGLSDYPANPDAKFFVENTAPDSVVLNSWWLDHPASVAGRKIFMGYSYFTWSYGYDQVTREKNALQIYRATTKSSACELLNKFNISFVELNDRPESFINPNRDLWGKVFTPQYSNPSSGVNIYNIKASCPNSSS